MPLFRYEAVDDQGHNIGGTMSAEDEPGLEKTLKSAGLWLVEAALEAPRATDAVAASNSVRVPLWGKQRRRALIDFCTMMGFQSRVGVPLVQALEVIGQQYENPHFRKVVADVQRQIEGGTRFHEALATHPRIFSTEFLGIIRAGELSSRLPETFKDLKSYLEWVDKVVQDVRSATLYPAIVLGVIAVFVSSLFTFVIPKFADLLAKLNVPLPLLTQIIFGLSEFAKKNWWIGLLLVLFLTVGLKFGRRWSPDFARMVDRVKLRLPIFGELNRMLAISRFTHNFVVLYRSGLPVLQVLDLCRGLVGNLVVADAVAGIQEDVKRGSSISDACRKSDIFPPMLLRMLMVGEKTGKLDAALEDVAQYYNQIIPERIKKMLTLLEPCLMLMLIGTVLIVALSIYLPLITLMGSIR